MQHTVYELPLTPRRRRELTGPALRTFFNIADQWALSAAELMAILGVADRQTLQDWRDKGTRALRQDTLERISCVLGIYKCLALLVPGPGRDAAWLRAPNTAPLFGGGSALERMTAGEADDLYRVRPCREAETDGCTIDEPS